jgi:hypothetical protein
VQITLETAHETTRETSRAPRSRLRGGYSDRPHCERHAAPPGTSLPSPAAPTAAGATVRRTMVDARWRGPPPARSGESRDHGHAPRCARCHPPGAGSTHSGDAVGVPRLHTVIELRSGGRATTSAARPRSVRPARAGRDRPRPGRPVPPGSAGPASFLARDGAASALQADPVDQTHERSAGLVGDRQVHDHRLPVAHDHLEREHVGLLRLRERMRVACR